MKRRHFVSSGMIGLSSLGMTRHARALAYYPMPSDLNCAIIYGTWCGSTRDAALWISEGMGGIADVIDVRENPNLSSYDHLVFGGAIRMNVVPQELQDLITQNKAMIQGKVRGLFAVCGNMGQPIGPEQNAMFIDNHLSKLTGITDVASHVFNGRITKSLMDQETRDMMTMAEDYDNLKRPECMAFGKEILNSIR